MICPDCKHENIGGVANCESCGQDLASIDGHAAASDLEARIMELPLERLAPREALIVTPETSVAEAVEIFCRHRVGCVLVGTREDVVGIFSERDLLLRTSAAYEKHRDTPVSEFMTPDPEHLDAGTSIAFALNRMATGDFRHVPVTRDGALMGVVSLRDVLRLLSEHYPDLLPDKAD